MRRVVAILAVGLLAATAAAKSYHYADVTTRLQLLPSGDVHVVQERTYEFSGRFSWAYVNLEKKGAAGIVFNRLAELRDGTWQDIRPDELTDGARSLYVKWSYSAEDEDRTFLLDYTLSGAVRRYQDVAELYWKVIEDEHEPMSLIHVDIDLPRPSPGLFKVYVHSAAAPGTLAFSAGFDTARIDQQGIPGNSFVEVRALASPDLFPAAPLQPGARYRQILAEEQRNFEAASLRRLLFLPLGLLLIFVLPLVLLLVLYFRYGREPSVDYQSLYEHEPPRPAPPVAVPLILRQKPEKTAMYQQIFQGMMATLLDLARRRVVSVHEVKHGHHSKYEFHLDDAGYVDRAEGFDRPVIDFLFGRVGGGTGVLTQEKIKDYGRGHSTEVQSVLGDVFDSCRQWWRTALGVDFVESASARAYVTFVLVCLASVGLGWFLAQLGLAAVPGGPGRASIVITGALAILLLMVFVFAGRAIYRWTPTALVEHKRWKAFRRFLGDFSAIEQAPVSLLAIWEQYYVYAVALGVADEFLKHVVRLAEQRGAGMALPVWYVAAAGTPGAGVASLSEGLSGFQSFASNVTSMMSSFSTASASGGGFSGGGGGGGGGGSSGAG